MYKVGRQLGMFPEEIRNPGTEIVPFPEKKRRRYVTLAEMPLLAAAIDAGPNEFAGHALWLLLLTGVRRGEILAAKWSDWDNGTLYIGDRQRALDRHAQALVQVTQDGTAPAKPMAHL